MLGILFSVAVLNYTIMLFLCIFFLSLCFTCKFYNSISNLEIMYTFLVYFNIYFSINIKDESIYNISPNKISARSYFFSLDSQILLTSLGHSLRLCLKIAKPQFSCDG